METFLVIICVLCFVTNLIGCFCLPLVLDVYDLSDVKNMYIDLFKSANVLGYFIIIFLTTWFLPALLLMIFIFTCEIFFPFILDIIEKIAFNKR